MSNGIPEPIVILGSPRSGTSLTASIFAAHGVWVGTSRAPDEANPRGYYENDALAELRYLHGHGDGLDPAAVHDMMAADGYTGGPWLVKHSPPTWRAWRRFRPRWVFVHRGLGDIVASRIRCGQWAMALAEHKVAVLTDRATMNGIRDNIGGLDLFARALLDRRWAGLRTVFDYCGLTLDEGKAEKCIDPELWHGEKM